MSTALIGKYFLCIHDECWRSGIVEAAVNDGHYIVRFDDLDNRLASMLIPTPHSGQFMCSLDLICPIVCSSSWPQFGHWNLTTCASTPVI
jgi:hypothetical protein